MTLDRGRGRHRKYLAYAFTEQGIAMLSSVLRSPRAIRVNVEIMRAFVRFRQAFESRADLWMKINELEEKCDDQFAEVFLAIKALMASPARTARRIGYRA